MNQDFFNKLAANPRLLRAVSDPRLSPFLQEMQDDPKRATARMKVCVCALCHEPSQCNVGLVGCAERAGVGGNLQRLLRAHGQPFDDT
jgi:hypothetical protein